MTPMPLGLFVMKLQPKVCLVGYDIAYFVVEAKSKKGSERGDSSGRPFSFIFFPHYPLLWPSIARTLVQVQLGGHLVLSFLLIAHYKWPKAAPVDLHSRVRSFKSTERPFLFIFLSIPFSIHLSFSVCLSVYLSLSLDLSDCLFWTNICVWHLDYIC